MPCGSMLACRKMDLRWEIHPGGKLGGGTRVCMVPVLCSEELFFKESRSRWNTGGSLTVARVAEMPATSAGLFNWVLENKHYNVVDVALINCSMIDRRVSAALLPLSGTPLHLPARNSG